MRCVIDIEANGLVDPDQIWLIVCKDTETGEYFVFKNLTSNQKEKARFLKFAEGVKHWIGHNLLDYDLPHLERLLGLRTSVDCTTDTLILSKLINYSRPEGHSLESYGNEFGFEKGSFFKFTDKELYNADSLLSRELLKYCIRDVDITHKVYLKYLPKVLDKEWAKSISLEHSFQLIANSLHTNGFYFNKDKANKLLGKVSKDLGLLDDAILDAFPPREVLIREFTPKATKHGTISKTSVPRALHGAMAEYEVGVTYRHTRQDQFNPSSHKQLIDVLSNSGWMPVDKTQTHIDTERELRRLQYSKERSGPVDADSQYVILKAKLEKLKSSGWRINETNLATLPVAAPLPARLLAKRIMLEARRRTLTEWLNLICLEIKIERASIEELGRAIKEKMILSGVPRNANITGNDIEKEILSYLENRICTTELFTHKKNANEGITLNLPTELVCKSLISWLKTKGVNVNSAEERENFLWITIIPQGKLEVSSANLATQCLDGLRTEGLRYSVTSQRIKGKFLGIGAWTHRMAHQNPNTANIPTDAKLHGAEMRALWQAPKNRLLVGVDAEGIQLRIFAHYINDPEFTKALVEGKKDDKSDPHSLNQRVLGAKSRNIAKRFIFAYLLGAGIGKLAQILELSDGEARVCLDRLLEKYEGLARLKDTVIPIDAKRGYFTGLDGRLVRLPGDSPGERKHLCMSGYLQNGEAIVMKSATVKWHDKLKKSDAILVNLVHDEWQTECPNDMEVATRIAKMQADSLREVGEELGLLCPLAGSYWNDDAKDFTIGVNWKQTH